MTQTERKPQLFTRAQLAVRWNCSPRTVDRKISAGELKVILIGERTPRIHENEIEAYEASHARCKVGA
jgi:hypothetical protein